MGVLWGLIIEYSTKYRAEIIETIVTSPTITKLLMKGM